MEASRLESLDGRKDAARRLIERGVEAFRRQDTDGTEIEYVRSKLLRRAADKDEFEVEPLVQADLKSIHLPPEVMSATLGPYRARRSFYLLSMGIASRLVRDEVEAGRLTANVGPSGLNLDDWDAVVIAALAAADDISNALDHVDELPPLAPSPGVGSGLV